MWYFSTNQGPVELPMRDAEAIARNAYRRVCERIDETIAEAANLRLNVPAEFASTEAWYAAEAAIDAATSKNNFAQALELCEEYERRAEAYCRKFLEMSKRA